MLNRAILVTAVLLWVAGAVAADDALHVRTMDDYNRHWKQMHLRVVLDGYREHGQQREQYGDEVQALIRQWNNVLYPFSTQDGVNGVTVAAKSLLDKGCSDPFVRYLYGWGLDRSNQNRKAEPVIRAAVEAFQDSSYPPTFLATAASRYARLLDDLTRREEGVAFHRLAAEANVQNAMASRSEEARWIWIDMFNYMDNLLPIPAARHFQQLIRDEENLDPWLREMALGTYHKRMAWERRGDGYASSVSDEKWKSFGEHLAQAALHLKRAHELHPDRPEAATEMIGVAMGGVVEAGQDEQYWFDKAQAAQIDWLPAYAALRWALRPRWGGSYDRMHRFGIECVDTKRYDTLVPYQYIRSLIEIGEEGPQAREYWRLPGIYERARTVLQHYAEQPVNGLSPQYAMSVQLGLATYVGQWDDAAELLKELGNDVNEYALRELGTTRAQVEQKLSKRQ